MIIRVNRFSYQVIICVQLDRTEQQRANKELHSTLITLRAILCISTRKLISHDFNYSHSTQNFYPSIEG